MDGPVKPGHDGGREKTKKGTKITKGERRLRALCALCGDLL